MSTLTAYKPDELINLSQAAEILDVSYPTVFALIARGELVPVKIADRQYLVKRDVEDLKRGRSGESK